MSEIIFGYIKEILPYLASLIIGLLSYLGIRIARKSDQEKIKTLTEQLEKAKSRETYIKCPKCGERLPLSDVVFYLPGDVKDNNLNGVPDDLE